ncbi:hypothetical protein KQX54_004869 [Cotesia glomerata]|uniref:Uncharacterized protein n=1 Tax=Cotesia glomerata TaxID=32391 RepID=A0AAV7I2N3_COTGL|nr:hypothetical protein KQX54_004869 [Cotesia glomerata]
MTLESTVKVLTTIKEDKITIALTVAGKLMYCMGLKLIARAVGLGSKTCTRENKEEEEEEGSKTRWRISWYCWARCCWCIAGKGVVYERRGEKNNKPGTWYPVLNKDSLLHTITTYYILPSFVSRRRDCVLRMLSRYGPFSRASADIIREEPQYSLLLLLCATVCVSPLGDGRCECECECECKGPFTLPPTFQGPKRSCGQAEPDRGPPCQVGTHSRWWDVEYKAPYTNHPATVLPASAFSFSVPLHTKLHTLLFRFNSRILLGLIPSSPDQGRDQGPRARNNSREPLFTESKSRESLQGSNGPAGMYNTSSAQAGSIFSNGPYWARRQGDGTPEMTSHIQIIS